MAPAYISRPAIALAPHKVLTEEIVNDIKAHHPTHPRIRTIPRHITRSAVGTRYFSHPLHSPYVGGAADPTIGITERTAQAYADAVDMAEAAARQLLDDQGVAPEEVDVLITSHSVSGGRLPGIDIPLADRLGLRPDVCRMPFSVVACAGGALAMARTADMLAARPDATVLSVVSEPLSTTYSHADHEISHMIFKGLFGDAAAAFLGTSTRPTTPSLRIDASFEYRLPTSAAAYFTRPDAAGVHFDSTAASLTAVKECLPKLTEWVRDWKTDIPIIHTGSPGIITATAHALGLDDQAARHSHNSLEQIGNVGGSAALDILARTHDAPPADGANVTVVAYGPGFYMAACRGVWCA
ncbi:hypothetical protein ADL22_12565 [Streptomyces sp. NRRL F-4489]|uniref:hypothetical protein n=1 Tax=Streptomyces sp. NRRL F-4489 TaxID=1609095 RepID=UPI00074A2AD9|nr:hypothetical protein [Streptomyces sp. NRRL F-4489]KUL44769.1 hypothetical protein ADL22_12565 [Streptomyces sp. NRRL F-4489]